MDIQKHGQTGKWTYIEMDRQINGHTEIDRQVDGQTDKCTHKEMYRQVNGHTKINGQTDIWTDRLMDIQRNGQTDRGKTGK